MTGHDHNDHELPQRTRAYQQEMLDASLNENIIIALETGAGKTHIAQLRIKLEIEKEVNKISWFLAPTVALCSQQMDTLRLALPGPIGLVSGASEPLQWKDARLWERVLTTHRVVVSTPQVLLDAMCHGYVQLGRDISLLIFDEAHHAVDKHPYNLIMKDFYFRLPGRGEHGRIHSVPSVINPTAQVPVVRPMVLGLSASPIYGGDIAKAFAVIEGNLDSRIRTPRFTRDELGKYVHRPTSRIRNYRFDNALFSTNLAHVEYIVSTLDIENDPFVKSLRRQLPELDRDGAKYRQIDQKLSNALRKEDTFTHRGLRDLIRAAQDILSELGVWAVDWFLFEVLSAAKKAVTSQTMMSTWRRTEKAYLLSILERMHVDPPSYFPDEIIEDASDKLRVLVSTLLEEKKETEAVQSSPYSAIVFVTRRQTVLALAEILSHHPQTKDTFQVGCLLGTSESSKRHSFLDITTQLRKEDQGATLRKFKVGLKNLIISTSVAEEGIDVQACCSVIRWDLPVNMVSWAQSRGRARKEKSTFILMVSDNTALEDIDKWEKSEQDMVRRYLDPTRYPNPSLGELGIMDEDENLEFRVESTGALLTPQSAIPHLEHFCSVICSPGNRGNTDFRPIYEADPPDLPMGWHSMDDRAVCIATGPFGSTLTLPRHLPPGLRVFSSPKIFSTKISAHRRTAFDAYMALYKAGLVDDRLLPLSDSTDPSVAELLKKVGYREGTTDASPQLDPWIPLPDERDPRRTWHASEVVIQGTPTLYLFTRVRCEEWRDGEGPVLHHPTLGSLSVVVRDLKWPGVSSDKISEAQLYTRDLFWGLNGSKMVWDNLDFSYLFLPTQPHVVGGPLTWTDRDIFPPDSSPSTMLQDRCYVNAEVLGAQLGHPNNLILLKASGTKKSSKLFLFTRWRSETLSSEEILELSQRYPELPPDSQINYPLIEAEPLPPRTNCLLPLAKRARPGAAPETRKPVILIPKKTFVLLQTRSEVSHALILPSFLRAMAMNHTAASLKQKLCTDYPTMADIPLSLLTTAITAPTSQEKENYQRLETLGDTVLKLVTSLQLLAEYYLWHEGYLASRKDHIVANIRLCKDALGRGLDPWIIRDRMLGRKWRPAYVSTDDHQALDSKERLSTKVLADVVESLIGAAYIQGGLDLSLECIRYFELGFQAWKPLPVRFQELFDAVPSTLDVHLTVPPQIQHVERMLGYVFKKKLLLIEALTHASCQHEFPTVSYERMEFLGDAVLDMVITDYLYHAVKKYSPGHIFLRRSAMVNGHLLAFVCLGTSMKDVSEMPKPDLDGNIILTSEEQSIYLWQCLMFSEHNLVEELSTTFTRFEQHKLEIQNALNSGSIFPWAALTRVRAPKLFSDLLESVIGAIYVDSGGSVDTVIKVMRHIGLYQILERIVLDDVDVQHPVSRLAMYTSRLKKKLDFRFVKSAGKITCSVFLDEEEVVAARSTEIYTGRASQDGAKYCAAEAAVSHLKLRNGGLKYKFM